MLPASALARPLALGQARANLALPVKPMAGGKHYGAWLKQQKIEAMMSKLSEGTRIGYEGGRRQRCAHRKNKRQDPWLPRRTREERMTDEGALFGFCILLASVLRRAEGAIKQKLFAVRCAHLVFGFADPLLHRGRLRSPLAALKRNRGPTARKMPVAPRMLAWQKDYLRDCVGGLSLVDACAAWAAICTAFFFFLRTLE